MSEYRLEVRRLPVRVVGLGGDAFTANVFLHQAGELQPGPETLGERLNAPRVRFLPFEIGDAVELVNLAVVAYVEHAGELPEVATHLRVGGRREPVAVRLRSGEELAGDLLNLFTGDGNRPSDRLNAEGNRFLLLVEGDTVRYVNSDAVAALRF